MRIVIDTNVLMSGVFWKGQPAQILEYWADDLLLLVISEEIFSEYKRVSEILSKKYKVENIDALLDLIAVNAHFVNPVGIDYPKCNDPDDDKFLAAAVSAHAKYIVTGDKALLKVGSYKGGSVVTVKEFLERF